MMTYFHSTWRNPYQYWFPLQWTCRTTNGSQKVVFFSPHWTVYHKNISPERQWTSFMSLIIQFPLPNIILSVIHSVEWFISIYYCWYNLIKQFPVLTGNSHFSCYAATWVSVWLCMSVCVHLVSPGCIWSRGPPTHAFSRGPLSPLRG